MMGMALGILGGVLSSIKQSLMINKEFAVYFADFLNEGGSDEE